jgi:DNA-binding response OmpR family regulator
MAHILLVDDDPQVAAANVAALEANGHTVATVTNTSEAAAAVATAVPDAVILEAMLDGAYAGLDLARSLARDFPTVPLIMLTRADEHLTSRERSGQDRDGWLPVQRYLEKPVSADVLLYEIDHLLPGAH